MSSLNSGDENLLEFNADMDKNYGYGPELWICIKKQDPTTERPISYRIVIGSKLRFSRLIGKFKKNESSKKIV